MVSTRFRLEEDHHFVGRVPSFNSCGCGGRGRGRDRSLLCSFMKHLKSVVTPDSFPNVILGLSSMEATT